MSLWVWFVLAAAAGLVALGFYWGARFGAGLPAAGPVGPRVQFSRAPHPDGEAWRATTVYVYLGDWYADCPATFRFGSWWSVLYVGIAFDPQSRAQQHWDAEREVELCRQVRRIDAACYPDRYAALAAEHALIDLFDPPFNTAPGSSCDAHTDPRPPIVPVRVRLPRHGVIDLIEGERHGQIRPAAGARARRGGRGARPSVAAGRGRRGGGARGPGEACGRW